jgi:ribonuclease HI
MTLLAFTDGASRGNPGEAGVGVIVKDEHGAVLLSMSGYIGKTTNNVAEYAALLALLKNVRRFPCTHMRVHSDSELMVRQLRGEYKVKDPSLKRQHQKVKAALAALPFKVEFRYIPRNQNAEADLLANAGIDHRTRIIF